MVRSRPGLPRIMVIIGVALALMCGGAFAKPGNGNGPGGGKDGGGPSAGGGKDSGGPAGGGPAGGGPAGKDAGGPAGGGASSAGGGSGGHGSQAAVEPSGPAASSVADPTGPDGGRNQPSSAMLGQAVVALNATYAVPHAPMQTAQELRMRQMADYDRTMRTALAMPANTLAGRAARDRAVTAARLHLAAATSRRLNSMAVARIDIALGLPAADPHLGVR